MNKDYKAKLLEKAGIYIDCCHRTPRGCVN